MFILQKSKDNILNEARGALLFLLCLLSCPALLSLWPALSLRLRIMPSTKFQSPDGEIFEVEVEIPKQSVTIKTMVEDLGMDDEDDDDPVPLPSGNAAILTFSGAPATRKTLLLLRMMRSKKNKQMITLYGTKNSRKLTNEHFLNLLWLQTL